MINKKINIATMILTCGLSCFAKAQTGPNVQVKLQQALQTPIAQQKLADCDFQAPAPVSFGNGTMAADAGGTVTLRGVDRRGKTWTAIYQATPGAGCQLWQTYLEPGGEADLVFLQMGANSSGGWDTVLSVLLFDSQGRPFPWQATGKFTTNKDGIRELVQLGEEKKLAVIVPEQQSDAQGNVYHSYHAYTFTDARTTELIGVYGGVKWPLTDLSPLQQKAAIVVPYTLTTAGQSAGSDEVPPNSPHYMGLKGINDSERQLVMSNTSFPLPDVLIVDSAAGRKIVSSPMHSDLTDLQANRAAGITLGNDCSNGDCHPLLLWLKQ
jgi:hypothetical protein